MRERGEGDRLSVIEGVRGADEGAGEVQRELAGTALLIDYENLVPDARWGGAELLDHLVRWLRAGVMRAYADWGRFQEARRTLARRGIGMVDATAWGGAGRKVADMRMCVDAMELLLTRPHLHTFVLVTGDSDFTPLMEKLREHGRRVEVVARKGTVAGNVRVWCDTLHVLPESLAERPVRAKTEPAVPAPVAEADPVAVAPQRDRAPVAAAVKSPSAPASEERTPGDAVRLLRWAIEALALAGDPTPRLAKIGDATRLLEPAFAPADYGFSKSKGFKAIPLSVPRLCEVVRDEEANDLRVQAKAGWSLPDGPAPERFPLTVAALTLAALRLPCGASQVARLLAVRGEVRAAGGDVAALRTELLHASPGEDTSAREATLALLDEAAWFSPRALEAGDEALIASLAGACATRLASRLGDRAPDAQAVLRLFTPGRPASTPGGEARSVPF